MERRTLLKTMAAAGVALPFLGGAVFAETAKLVRRVRPGDAAWPNAAAWQSLKDKVGGNLLTVQTPFAACATDPKGAACRDAVANIGNPFYLGDQPGGTQVSGWFEAWSPAPTRSGRVTPPMWRRRSISRGQTICVSS